MGLAHSPRIVTDGLVLCLDAANPKSYPGTGTVWNDLSGNGNNGTLVNGVGYSADNNGSFVFDGVNDYVVVTSPYYTYQKEITVSAWVKFNNFQYILSQAVKDVDNMASNVWLWHATTGGFIWYVNDNGSWRNTAYTSFNTGIWYFVTTTANASNTLIYVNGVQVAAGGGISTQILNVTNSQVATNDHRYSASRPPHNGNISNISIYNRALTPQEITKNFNALRGRYGI